MKDIKIKIDFKDCFRKFTEFADKKNHWILILIFLVFMGYCSYLWYNYIISPGWEEEKKQEYINTKQKEIIFSKVKFDGVIRGIETKKNEYQKNIENIPDVFRLK
jgi:nucleosome binding factor SPN SPT16 subunit